MGETLPVIDMAPLLAGGAGRGRVAGEIAQACEAHGFFYLVGHGVTLEVLGALEAAGRAFFARPEAEKMAIAMSRGGRAWRGYFPVGGELTSGRPDLKEGLYLGTELPADHPRVRAGLPMHGANLWPAGQPRLRAAVTAYMDATTRAAAALMEGVSLSLGLPADYFAAAYTGEPTVLFRIFHYPATGPGDTAASWLFRRPFFPVARVDARGRAPAQIGRQRNRILLRCPCPPEPDSSPSPVSRRSPTWRVRRR